MNDIIEERCGKKFLSILFVEVLIFMQLLTKEFAVFSAVIYSESDSSLGFQFLWAFRRAFDSSPFGWR
jgi:hypothetical protein